MGSWFSFPAPATEFRTVVRVVLLVALALLPALSAAQGGPSTNDQQSDVGAETAPDAGRAAVPSRPRSPIDISPAAPTESNRPLGKASRVASPASSIAVKPAANGTTSTVVRTITSLAAVLGLIVLSAIVVRHVARRKGGLMSAIGAGGRAPSGVLSVLARYPIARTQTIILLKLPRRVLLVAQTRGVRGASSLSTLCEIADADEVADLVLKSQESDGQSIARKFGQVLHNEDRALGRALGEPQTPRVSRRVTIRPSGDSTELSKPSSPQPRGYAAPAQDAGVPAKSGLQDELQQRMAALRQLAIDRNRRAS